VGYAGKVEERARARELRAEGRTMPDIAAELGVSRGSVSAWTRDIEVVVRRRSSPRQPNALQRAKAAEIAALLADGRRRIGELSERDLLIAGTALYAGEGFKRDGLVGLANNDPHAVALFLRWLRACFTIDERRLRCSVYLHDGLDLAHAEAHWGDVTGIPAEQFRKAQRVRVRDGHRRARHPNGCARVWYSCSSTHRAILGLVAALLSSQSHIPR
jgi:AcrR family transcriptional regulator